jgi:hypothetical protein
VRLTAAGIMRVIAFILIAGCDMFPVCAFPISRAIPTLRAYSQSFEGSAMHKCG